MATVSQVASTLPGFEDLTAEYVTSDEKFGELRDEWRALFERAGQENAFLSFEWMHTWWEHWGRNGRLAMVTVRNREQRLVAIAPLYVARLFPRRLSFLADQHVGSDYLNLLVEPGCEAAAIEEIVRELMRRRRDWDSMEFCDAADVPLFRQFCQRLESAGLRGHTTTASLCYHILLPPSFDTYLGRLSTSLRRDFRRRWKVIHTKGQVEFGSVSSAEEIERLFPELLHLHAMRSDQRGRKSAFLRPGVPEFHKAAAKALAAAGRARLFLLRVDGETVAALYGFSIGRTFQFFQCGMHTGWLHEGVGQLLVGNTIDQAIAAGHTDFDFLRGPESYKARWADHSRHTLRARFFCLRSPAALAAFAVFRAGMAAAQAESLVRQAAHLPGRWRTRMATRSQRPTKGGD